MKTFKPFISPNLGTPHNVRALLRVKMNIHSMCNHDIFWLKRFPTLVTCVSCLFSVFSQMLFEQRRRCEDLQTLLVAPMLELLMMFKLLSSYLYWGLKWIFTLCAIMTYFDLKDFPHWSFVYRVSPVCFLRCRSSRNGAMRTFKHLY